MNVRSIVILSVPKNFSVAVREILRFAQDDTCYHP